MCTEKERGKFLYSAPDEHQAHIYTEWINARTNKTEPHEMRYNVSKTGWYCINSVSVSDFEADVYWESPFGKAPASEYPKLLASYLVFVYSCHLTSIYCYPVLRYLLADLSSDVCRLDDTLLL